MKRILLFLFAAICAANSLRAYDFKSGDLCYNITSNVKPYEVEVTANYSNQDGNPVYWGIKMVVIPTSIEHNGKTYSVTSIGRYAFEDCTGLFSVTIPNSVTNIGSRAFSGCKGLTSVTIPNSVTSIERGAFSGCTGLTSVTIPNSVTIIGERAFYGCTGLTSVTIPNSVTSIGSYAFNGVPNIVYHGSASGSPWGAKNVNRYVDGYLVYKDSTKTRLLGCSSIVTKISIPESVTSIEYHAFEGCTGLTSITIPESVTNISPRAFDNTPWYENQPDGIMYINRILYGYKGEMPANTSILVKDGITSIGWYAFSGCTGLTSITIPNSVTIIGERAFYGCTGLTSITIPNSVTSIGERAFSGCTGLTSVTIPNSVKSIGESAFSGCTGLTSVTIPNSVKSIGERAFYGVPNIVYNGSASGSPWGARSVNGYVDGYLVYSDATKTQLLDCSSTATGKITIPNSVTSIGESAFGGCTGLTSVTIPNSVTSIGNYAFSGCTGLTSVTIPNSVKSIGNYTFSGCTGLTSVTIPNSVTSIGNYAFSGCTGLTSITIPNSVTIIGERAFYGCTGLTSVTIPGAVYSIGESAFSGCKGLTSVVIGDGVGKIENSAFYLCTGLTSVTIPESVWSIGWYAFADCTGLTSISIPKSVTSIGTMAFEDVLNVVYQGSASSKYWGARNVNGYVDGYLVYNDATKTQLLGCGSTATGKITIPNSVTSIKSNAFSGCFGLTSITIPNSVTSIGGSVFSGCSGLTSITIPNSVTSIGESAFGGCTGLTSITIPNSVTSIGDEAFAYCTGLTSVTIPNSVKSIGERAFYGVPNIVYNGSASGSPWEARSVNGYVDGYLVYSDAAKTRLLVCNSKATGQITIPNSVTSIGDEAFYKCSDLTSITIPESVTSIGERAFYGCSSLAKTNYTGDIAGWCNIHFAISNSVSPTSNPVFCSSNLYINDVEVKDLVIPNSVTSIGWYAFRGCTGLTSVTIGNGVTSIGWYAFRGCTGLTSVTIGNGVTNIGESAFSGCTGLTSVTIGNGVTSIGDYAFSGCTGLTSITIPNSVTSIEEKAFSGCTGLTSVTIGNGVTSIESSAFSGCTGLTSVVIPENVTSIGESAFSDCTGLTSIVIGRQVRSIDNNVFPGCTSLHSVIVKALTPPTIKGYLFNDGHPYYPRILYTPCGHLSAYQEADEWKWFADIQEPPVFEVEVNVVSELEGSASVDSESTCDMEATISATPNDGYRFTYWSDGNTDNPRTIVLTQDTVLTAYFEEIPTYAVSLSCDAKQGTVSGEGTYQEGKQVSVSATPKTGYRFTQWSDGNTDNPRTIVLTQDTVLTAYFEEIPTYAVSLSCDAEQGTVSGEGTYQEGEQVTVSAMPNEGYEFVQWSDGNTDNPRSWIVTEDVSLSAIFQPVTALPQTTAASQETQKVVKDGQVLILRNGKAYDMLGQEIR